MKRETRRAALAIVGAVIGAGFASGRELCAFFSRYGIFSWGGIVCAVMTIVWSLGRLRRLPEHLIWRIAFGLLTAVTGGAMLACAGEIAALALPIHGAYGVGMALVMLLTVLANGKTALLSGVSRLLMLCLLTLLAAGLLLPGQGVALGDCGSMPQAAISGVCYGGFNAALALPVIAEMEEDRRQAALRCAGIALLLLLAAGNGVMLRHPELRGETMPLILLAGRLGKPGYYACCATMGLAVLTTAIAADKGLSAVLPDGWRMFGRVLMLSAALLGFKQIVAWLYPALGAACFLILILSGGQRRDAAGHF